MCKVLIFSCISAVMLVTAAYGAPTPGKKELLLRALTTDLKLLEKSKDKIHVDLYTPNEKQECTWQTLECYVTEMGTLEHEIEDKDVENLRNIKNNLQALKDLMPEVTGCKRCEANDRKMFPAFLQALTNFLTSMQKEPENHL